MMKVQNVILLCAVGHLIHAVLAYLDPLDMYRPAPLQMTYRFYCSKPTVTIAVYIYKGVSYVNNVQMQDSSCFHGI